MQTSHLIRVISKFGKTWIRGSHRQTALTSSKDILISAFSGRWGLQLSGCQISTSNPVSSSKAKCNHERLESNPLRMPLEEDITSNQNHQNRISNNEREECHLTVVKEGRAEVLIPSAHDVFYNPVMEFNRDLSVAVLRVFAKEYKDLERERREKAKLKKKWKQQKGEVKGFAEFPPTEEKVDSQTPVHQELFLEESEKNIEEEKKKNHPLLLPPGVRDDEGIRILEALAASGLRSIRYAQEVGGVQEIIANDLSDEAVRCIQRNVTHNAVGDLVRPSHSDASMLMYQNREPSKRYHAIDLDPYGSPHQFLDGAIQSVAEGGILLVTCTDMAVLCGNSPETAYVKYGSLSIKSKASHEIALRIVLRCLESHANRYSRYIVPLLSVSADFYVRVVVKVFTSQAKCKESFSKAAMLYQCTGCETLTLEPLGHVIKNGPSIKYKLSSGPAINPNCVHCGHHYQVAGPLWASPIHDPGFLKTLKASLVETDFATYNRLFGMISMMEEELTDVPLYYLTDKLASVAGVTTCKMSHFRSALLNAGYRVSMSHACKASVKTDAPARVIWDIIRAWERLHPANRTNMADDRPGKRILDQESQTNISFDLHPDADPESRKRDLLRFQLNPKRCWGPKSRAKMKSSSHDNTQDRKSNQNQGKKRKYSNGD